MAKTGATTYSISFYQKDGAFTSNRTVNLNGNYLTFSGGNVGIGVAPTADQLFIVHSGVDPLITIDKTTFESKIKSSDGLVTGGFTSRSDFSNSIVNFIAESNSTVFITGDGLAETITLTAANGTILSDLAGNGAGVVAVDNAGLLSWSAAGGGSFDYTQVLFAQVFS